MKTPSTLTEEIMKDCCAIYARGIHELGAEYGDHHAVIHETNEELTRLHSAESAPAATPEEHPIETDADLQGMVTAIQSTTGIYYAETPLAGELPAAAVPAAELPTTISSTAAAD